MILFPGLALREGRAVLLTPDGIAPLEGDPAAWAAHWRDAGAQWLHVLSLDASFTEAAETQRALRRVIKVGPAVQFGGGLHTLDAVAWALDLGAARVVLGSPLWPLLGAAVAGAGSEAVALALDVWDDPDRSRLLAEGWRSTLDSTPEEIARQAAAVGVCYAVLTNVSRIGTRRGADVGGASRLARASGLRVIAAGGVRNLEDLTTLWSVGGIAGAVVGSALMDGSLKIDAALRALATW